MDATSNFSPELAQVSESKADASGRLFNGQTLQRISTAISLISLAVGFAIFGMLIMINRHQADLNGFSGGSCVAIVGGISAILVGTVFLVAAYLHWRFCARRSVAFPVRRQTARLTFYRAEPAMPIAVLSS
jgi:uncharacterized membrane protein YidH (DUF202 family)